MNGQCVAFYGKPLTMGIWGQGPHQKEKTQ